MKTGPPQSRRTGFFDAFSNVYFYMPCLRGLQKACLRNVRDDDKAGGRLPARLTVMGHTHPPLSPQAAAQGFRASPKRHAPVPPPVRGTRVRRHLWRNPESGIVLRGHASPVPCPTGKEATMLLPVGEQNSMACNAALRVRHIRLFGPQQIPYDLLRLPSGRTPNGAPRFGSAEPFTTTPNLPPFTHGGSEIMGKRKFLFGLSWRCGA